MIRGTTAQFQFNMPYPFDDLCIIEAKFWQPGNQHPNLPITKAYNRQFIVADSWPLEDADETKVYSYDGLYYKHEAGGWTSTATLADFVRNDGITHGADTPEQLFTSLTPEETLRFTDERKAYVQVKAYCDTRNVLFASLEKSFTVYPAEGDSIFGDIGQSAITTDGVQILDAGSIA